MRTSVIVSFFLISFYLKGQDSLFHQYIAQYKDIAVSEMIRTGVPASIKLAQGILESGKGQSKLAKESNNHFGIKCKEDWSGKTYYHNDDDYNDEGKLIKSCFRVYDHPEDSYFDHSEFLRNRAYYTHLFDLETTDYKGWAKGLKDAKYASVETYDASIIGLINRFHLHQYDTIKDQTFKVYVIKTWKKYYSSDSYDQMVCGENDWWQIKYENHFYRREDIPTTINGIPVTFASHWGMDTIYKKYHQFNDWNEDLTHLPYQPIYLAPKKKKLINRTNLLVSIHKNYKYVHKVLENQTIQYISTYYGIAENSLRSLNLLNKYEEPAPGALIALKKKRKSKPIVAKETVLQYPFEPLIPVHQIPKISYQKPTYTFVKHVVAPKQTMWAISRLYNISLVTIKKDNNLSSDVLEDGQTLQIRIKQ